MDQYPKFSDFATEEGKLDGEKVKLKDIFGKEILITGHSIHKSKFKDAADQLNINNPLKGVSW